MRELLHRQHIACFVDEPVHDVRIDAGWFWVRGWAFSRSIPVARVEVALGGHWLGRAGLGRPRPDVANALGEPDAEFAGFELQVTTPPGLKGDVSLEVTVALLDGSQATWLVRLDVHAPAPSLPAHAVALRPRRRWRGTTDAIRVLWFARALDQGGSQLRMAEMVQHLRTIGGFAITVASPVDGPLRPVLEAAGAAVQLIPPVPLDDIARYEQAVDSLTAWADGRFDLVVGATVTSFWAVEVAGRLGLPSVLRIGEAAPLRSVVAWLFGVLDPAVECHAAAAFSSATVVVSNSAAAVRNYRADGYRGRFVMLPTGVDLGAACRLVAKTSRDECRHELGIKPDELLMLCVATLWPIKGQAILVQAIEQLHHRHQKLGCALVGYVDEAYRRAIVGFLDRHELAGRIRVIPFCDDLSAWWRAADVAVCTSESEAMPAAVLEAMAHRLPVLGCRVGDLPDLLEPGVTGWLCHPCDLRELIASLEVVVSTPPEVRVAMGEAAARRIARSYDRTRALARTAELLRDAARGRLSPTTTEPW